MNDEVNHDAYSTSVRLSATPECVFPYLTDAALMVRWMGDWAELDPVEGGAFVVDINGIPIRGRYLAVEPPRRVVFTWGAAGNDRIPPESTVVEITLHAEGDETVLELVHRQLPTEELPQHGVGWGHFLERLSIAATGNDPGPDPWSDETSRVSDGT
jgi:uncharacterized protein YndB with AHSA1/START domain